MTDRLGHYAEVLSKGLPVTLSLSVAAIVVAVMLAIAMTLLLTSKNSLLKNTVKIYITIFTGTPLLVQLFLFYYGPAQFPIIEQNWPILWQIISIPWFCAFIALTLNSAAYTTQLFYGALKAIPQELWQACDALGMNKRQSLKVILPYALKRALSSYSNEVIFVVKGTALASTITLMDIMGYNQFLISEYYDFSIFLVTGTMYLLINGTLSLLMRIIEQKALKFESSS